MTELSSKNERMSEPKHRVFIKLERHFSPFNCGAEMWIDDINYKIVDSEADFSREIQIIVLERKAETNG